MKSRTIAGVVYDMEEYQPGHFRTINGSEVTGERFTLERLEPRYGWTDNPVERPVPAGATVVGTGSQTPEWKGGEYSIEKLTAVATVMDEAEKAGVVKTGFDWGGLLAMIGAGAAIGSAFPGLGTVIGAVVGALVFVGLWFAGKKKRGPEQYGAGVKAWRKVLMPQGMLDWLRASEQFELLSSIRAVQIGFLQWSITNFGRVVLPDYKTYNGIYDSTFFDPQFWSTETWENAYATTDTPDDVAQWKRDQGPIPIPQWVKDWYTMMGIDYDASVAKAMDQIEVNGTPSRGFVYLREALVYDKGLGDGSTGTSEGNGSEMLLLGAGAIALLLATNKR